MAKICEDDYKCTPYSLLAWGAERHHELYTSRITPDMSPYRVLIHIIEAYLETNEERRVFEEENYERMNLEKYFRHG